MHETADWECNGEPAGIRIDILVNFFITIISDYKLETDEGNSFCLQNDKWEWK